MNREWDSSLKKAQADADYNRGAVQGMTADTMCAQAAGPNPNYRPSLKDEAEKSMQYHREEEIKAAMAHAFFSANPVFEEFILLVRRGAIHF